MSMYGKNHFNTAKQLASNKNKWEKEQSTCQCRGHGFKPWSRKIPWATGQLSLWATATEPTGHSFWSPRAHALEPCSAERGRRGEKPSEDKEEQPLLQQQEKVRVQQWTLCSQKVINPKKERSKKSFYHFTFTLTRLLQSSFSLWESVQKGVHTHGPLWGQRHREMVWPTLALCFKILLKAWLAVFSALFS